MRAKFWDAVLCCSLIYWNVGLAAAPETLPPPVEKAMQSVFKVYCVDVGINWREQGMGGLLPLKKNLSQFTGSGFLVHTDGYVLTNAHVVESCSTVALLGPKGSMAVDLFAMSDTMDVALLRIQADSLKTLGTNPAALVLSTTTPPLRTPTWLIGAPVGIYPTVHSGFVSAPKLFEHRGDGQQYVQLQLHAPGGASGSPILNESGEVIGMMTWGYGAYGISFAVPSTLLLDAWTGWLDGLNSTKGTAPSL